MKLYKPPRGPGEGKGGLKEESGNKRAESIPGTGGRKGTMERSWGGGTSWAGQGVGEGSTKAQHTYLNAITYYFLR